MFPGTVVTQQDTVHFTVITAGELKTLTPAVARLYFASSSTVGVVGLKKGADLDRLADVFANVKITRHHGFEHWTQNHPHAVTAWSQMTQVMRRDDGRIVIKTPELGDHDVFELPEGFDLVVFNAGDTPPDEGGIWEALYCYGPSAYNVPANFET
jgi:hypothetical protein